MAAQNAVTNAFLEKIPFRGAVAKRFEELFDFPKVSGPMRVGDLYFIWKNSGLQNQAVINVRKGLDGEDRVFIDPNQLDPAGTTTYSPIGVSTDDRYMAVGVNKAGAIWRGYHGL
ncbi:MAG: hypothetical protein IPK99_14515 [Flavobacteriales bacterium]|nr:hypothetical protein [Flavobacteriales bacterium]